MQRFEFGPQAALRNRAALSSGFLACSFDLQHRCTLVTGPWPGHAPSVRLAPGQNPGAGKLEFMVARFLRAGQSRDSCACRRHGPGFGIPPSGGGKSCCARQHRGAAFTPPQGLSSKGHGRFNEPGCCQGEGIHPGRAMEWEEIAAVDGRERKRRERRSPTNCGCAGTAAVHPDVAGDAGRARPSRRAAGT